MLLCVASELTDCGVVFCFNVFISASPVFVGLSFSLFIYFFFFTPSLSLCGFVSCEVTDIICVV